MMLMYSTVVSADQTGGFDLSSISPGGRQAHGELLQASIFSLGPVGFAALRSESESALRTLLEEKEAIAALKDLLSNATKEGKMYALYGLYLKDQEVFRQELERYKASQVSGNMINTQSGCPIMPESEDVVVTKIETGQYRVYLR
jgi:hypothetical protein